MPEFPISPQEMGSESPEAELARLRRENEELRKDYAFIDIESPGMKEAIEQASERIENFLDEIKTLQGIMFSARYSSLGKAPECRAIFEMIDGFSTNGIYHFLHGIKMMRGTGRIHRTPSWDQSNVTNSVRFFEAVARTLFGEFIHRQYDQVLRACERFRCYRGSAQNPDNWDDETDIEPYNTYSKQLQSSIERANEILTSLGIKPLDLKFKERVGDRILPYVDHESYAPPMHDYYPYENEERGIIVDTKTWAYFKLDGLDEDNNPVYFGKKKLPQDRQIITLDNRLWQGGRARLIVTGNPRKKLY